MIALVTRYCSLLDNRVNSLSGKSKTTRGQTSAKLRGYGITVRSHLPPQTSPFCSLKCREQKIEPCQLPEEGSLGQITLGTTHNHELLPGISGAGRHVTLARLYSSSVHSSSAPSCLRFGEAWSACDSLTAVEKEESLQHFPCL